MRERPGADEFLAAFDGRIFRPAGDDVRIQSGGGWGASGEEVTSLSLHFLLGRSNDSVIVEVSRGSRYQPVSALQHLVFEFAVMRRPRFPMVIERSRQAVTVEGRSCTFTAYTAGAAAVATATLGEVDVMVRCSRRRLGRLALERIEPAELRRAARRPRRARATRP